MQTTNLDFSRDDQQVLVVEHRALRDSQLSLERPGSQPEQQQEPDHTPTEQPDIVQGYIIE